jgi:UDP-N-acetyl-D-glucosamine/UDP-N-acetyl-D-galactosamine dehydrogenase
MGDFVATQTVKLMIQQGMLIKGSVVTVLGFTFKENVPDLRNTRVIDIVKALREYGVEVQIHDPYASADEAHEEYGVELLAADKLVPADAVILAVPHAAYLDAGWGGVLDRLKDGVGIVMDVKARLDRTTRPAHITHWRL